MALHAVWQSTAADPPEAAFDALFCAGLTVGDRYPDLFAEVRDRFLSIDQGEVFNLE